MSQAHPIIAVTGSSGAGTTTVKLAFLDVFRRVGISAAFVDGDSFRRYDSQQMRKVVAQAQADGHYISQFGPEANMFEELEAFFKHYGKTGTGKIRHFVTPENQDEYSQPIGTFTDYEPLPEDRDMLLYEGFHGGVVASSWTRRRMSPSHNPYVIERRSHVENGGVDVAQHVDLLIGVAPVVNLEWIQKIHRDTALKGRSTDAIIDSILRRLQDYIHYIVPQFTVTDVNFQRVPIVDTSNPFIARDVPTADESILVVRVREPYKYDFPQLLKLIPHSFMSRPNTIVMPGGRLRHAIEVICGPQIYDLCEKKRRA